MSEADRADFLTEQGFIEETPFYEYEYAWSSNIVFQLSLYCNKNLTRGAGLIRKYIDGEYVDLEIFTFDGCEHYLDDAAVGQYSVYSYYSAGFRETYFLEGEAIDDYFSALELDGIHSVSFDYEDGKLVHMYQGLTHGSVDRFYIYRGACYMLEVDHGWGVTFYKFYM